MSARWCTHSQETAVRLRERAGGWRSAGQVKAKAGRGLDRAGSFRLRRSTKGPCCSSLRLSLPFGEPHDEHCKALTRTDCAAQREPGVPAGETIPGPANSGWPNSWPPRRPGPGSTWNSKPLPRGAPICSRASRLAARRGSVSCSRRTWTRSTPQTNSSRRARRNGRLFGRGACDTKGSVAAMLTALCELAQGRQRPAETEIIFAGLVDEEHGQAGSRALVASGLKADLAIVGEPTRLQVVTAHKGTVVAGVGNARASPPMALARSWGATRFTRWPGSLICCKRTTPRSCAAAGIRCWAARP